MSAASLDPRLHACRPDLADARLQGKVAAARFVEGVPRRVIVPSAPLRRVPRSDAGYDSELLRGETVRIFDETDEGWSWVQSDTDAYVGYVSTDALGRLAPEPTHRVTALRAFVYPGPDMKLPPRVALSIGSRVALGGTVETRGTLYRLLAGGEGAIIASTTAPLDAPLEDDFVAVAERFLGTPYLWGGRTSLGLDCSALVQLTLMMAGYAAPRDTDMQRDSLGTSLASDTETALRRGDLIFWPGHVAIVRDAGSIVHASGHHACVVIEPLAEARARIGKSASARPVVRRL
jgi:cell wall-associated NlpC family hydrolase